MPITIPSATAVKTVTTSGGNLFRIALDNLGDPLQWTRIAGANRLVDPFLPASSPLTLTVPPLRPAVDSSGVLAPSGGPIFALGGGLFPAIAIPPPPIITAIPAISAAPTISGSPQVGSQITAIDATWTNGVTATVYQWKVGGINATGLGATTLSYTPIIGDLGKTLTITVTAINPTGTSLPSTSAASSVVVTFTHPSLQLKLNMRQAFPAA
jgi:hypothetical protein